MGMVVLVIQKMTVLRVGTMCCWVVYIMNILSDYFKS